MSEGTPSHGKIKAVLFDMDGLLIDSEIIYTVVVNKILEPYGKEQTWEIKSRLMGTPERKSCEILLNALWPPSEQEIKQGNIISKDCPFTIESFLGHRNFALDDYFSKVKPMPGAQRLVSHLAKHKIPICVATGSKKHNYEVKTKNNQDLFSLFEGKVICGDDSRLKRGKPYPDVFLLAAREGLGIRDGIRNYGEEHDGEIGGKEGEILVFEDAAPGVKAAKAAHMPVVWVPDKNIMGVVEDLGATLTIDSLLDFKPEQFGLPPFDDYG